MKKHTQWRVLFVAVIVVLLPALLSAADEAEGQRDLTGGYLPTLAWSIIIFASVLFLLRAKAWGPIMKALDEREQKIRDSLEAAERALAESKERELEHEEVMRQARAEATAIVEEGKRDAQAVKDGIIADARRDSDEIARRAKAEIERAKNIAVDDMHKKSVELSLLLAEKVIRKSLSAADHEQLIRETIEGYDKVN